MIPVVDLFAGCGGLSQGFHDTDAFRTVAAVEWDLYAASTYAANFGGHVFNGDIAEWLEGSTPHASVVIGGPPCQGFSALGSREPRDPRNALWRRYVDAIRRVQPAFFVMENVPQFLKSGQFRALREATSPKGPLAGWVLEVAELNAADHGVAQARKRAVVVGRRKGTRPVGMPEPSRRRISVREAWRDVEARVDNPDLPKDCHVDLLGVRVPGAFKMREIHVTRRPTAISVARFRAIPPGGNRFDLPDELKAPCWRRHTTGSADVMGRLVWDRPSVTIRTEFHKPEKGRYLHPSEDRPITPYEAALLQGFPEHFQWCGTKTSIAKQIGNAVPPPLARAIAYRLADRL